MYKNILVPTDGSKLSDEAVKQAILLAKDTGAKLTFMHVMQSAKAFVSEHYNVLPALAVPVQNKYKEEFAAFSKKTLDGACAKAAALGLKCTGITVTGESSYQAIIKQAEKSKSDLIMMASHGRRGLDSVLIGSETQKVLTHSKIPVLVVR